MIKGLWQAACAGLRTGTVFVFWVAIWQSSALAGEFKRYPIVFAHGIGVPAALYERVVPLSKVASRFGYELHVARTPVVGTVAARAKILSDEILRLIPEGKFHLVGHSMGGLDARLAVHRPELKGRCLSITTLATPHHGSAVADYVIDNLDRAGEQSSLVRRIIDLFQGDLRAIRDLTTRHIENRFNQEVEDQLGIEYYSMGFYIPEPANRHSMVPLLWALHKIAGRNGREPNDGLVSVDSAHWGHSLGVFAADHWSETAPVPFLGGESYEKVFQRVTENLDRRFKNLN